MRRRLRGRSIAWWAVWAAGVICLAAGDLMGRPNAVHGLGVLLIGGLVVAELGRAGRWAWRQAGCRPYWRRWWITYGYGPRHRAGPFLTRWTAELACRGIWRHQAHPPMLAIVQEFRPPWWRDLPRRQAQRP